MDVRCIECDGVIGEYSGPTGINDPLESKYYTRVDGTKPPHGSSTTAKCPHCNRDINELNSVIRSAIRQMSPEAQRELIGRLSPEAQKKIFSQRPNGE